MPSRKSPGKRFARRERDRMQQAVERAPLGLQRVEQRGDLLVATSTSQRSTGTSPNSAAIFDDAIAADRR